MLAAIQLDHKFRAVIGKIGNVATYGRLLPEMESLAIELTKLTPEPALRLGFFSPKPSGAPSASAGWM